MDKEQQKSRSWSLPALILTAAIAAAFRLWGIRWGFPDELHQFTYHPDEIFQVVAMLRLDPFSLRFDPGFYNYPSGYMNLGSAALKTAMGYGLNVDGTLTGAYLVARLLTASLGVLTIPIVYVAASRLSGRAVGFVAALILAIMPLHVVHSHFATVDVPSAFWVAAALLGAAAILHRPSTAAYVLAGAAAGFAMGTKYNAAFAILPVLAAHFLREDTARFRTRIRDGRVWAAIGSFAAAFFLATPGMLLVPGRYAGGFLYEMKHAASGHGLVFEGEGPGWFSVLTNSLGYGLGILLLVIVLFSVALAVVRHKRSDLVLLSFIVPYFLLIALSKVHFARYAIPLLPPLAILAGRLMVEVQETLKEQAVPHLRFIWLVGCACVILYTSAYAVALDKLFVLPDPRDQAARWFESNVPPGAVVGLATVPWFYSPPLAPGIVGTVGRESRYDLMSESAYTLTTSPDREWDISILGPDTRYVVVTDFEYKDPLRLKLPAVVEFFRKLERDYKQAAVFRNPLRAWIDFGPTEMLPHDLKYMAPTVQVYRRK
ncbi:MAG: glycosyltransferase family 39 protein [Armatimonadetes bacterium]|nr:glycosyltransferase family 39 protein [Armatimonadota bacterium]